MRPMQSIIIATKNEEEAIAKVICSIPPTISRTSEVIVVDSSDDMTPIIAERLGAKVIREEQRGKGRAMRLGVKVSKSDILIFLDGDGTDPPEYIPELLNKLAKSNLVLGCRAMKNFKNDDLTTRRIFRIYGMLIRPIFKIIGFNVSDPLAGFRVLRKSDWDKMNLKSNGFEIEAEMNVKAVEKGFTVGEVPIPHLKRGGGLIKSKLVTDPRVWIKIVNVIIKYISDKQMKSNLKLLRSTLRKSSNRFKGKLRWHFAR